MNQKIYNNETYCGRAIALNAARSGFGASVASTDLATGSLAVLGF